ncbi:MAG TPA: FKBP-type peptidyl-prolyl cis-trans isomerase [Ktedonobacteraceae bacterium]|nr:FKBP-type peptidyl-prolyl cis-trans isomerase [Ktedonobacteraceae bacterium]
MPQTVNGQDASEQKPVKDDRPASPSASARTRPGQRQQERMQRLVRRRKRRRIWAASIAAFLVIALGITFEILYQNYNAQQATLHAHATATAEAHANATGTVIANATATVISQNCFLSSSGEAVPSVYASDKAPSAGPDTAPPLKGTATTMKDGLKYVDIKVGTGTAVTDGKTITANYTGWLASTCKKFDSSYDAHSGTAAAPISIQLATGSLIPGWVEGMVGMKPGGIRRLYIPAALGYGDQAAGSIPANSDLIFDVQLISFK